jgi:cytochrome P450
LVSESVELATILLTDLVGSTRLATSVGPARADELREEHFALLRDAIAGGGGKEVKNTGDGLMIAFTSASAAIKCAVAMQQLFERRYRNSEQGLHVRIGLGAGESSVKDGDYFGMPSIEAARLVLGMFLRTPDSQGHLMSDKEICDAMRTLLLGGHDTTASTLTWVLERVSRYPDALARLQTAALDGDDEYLDAVIKEAMLARVAGALA